MGSVRRIDNMGWLAYHPSFDGSWPLHMGKFFADGEHLIRLDGAIHRVRDHRKGFELVLSGRFGVCMILEEEASDRS